MQTKHLDSESRQQRNAQNSHHGNVTYFLSTHYYIFQHSFFGAKLKYLFFYHNIYQIPSWQILQTQSLFVQTQTEFIQTQPWFLQTQSEFTDFVNVKPKISISKRNYHMSRTRVPHKVILLTFHSIQLAFLQNIHTFANVYLNTNQ